MADSANSCRSTNSCSPAPRRSRTAAFGKSGHSGGGEGAKLAGLSYRRRMRVETVGTVQIRPPLPTKNKPVLAGPAFSFLPYVFVNCEATRQSDEVAAGVRRYWAAFVLTYVNLHRRRSRRPHCPLSSGSCILVARACFSTRRANSYPAQFDDARTLKERDAPDNPTHSNDRTDRGAK